MDVRLASKSGQGRSIALNPELLINMYAEKAPAGSMADFVLFSTPGFVPFVDLGAGFIRGFHRMDKDGGFFVVHGLNLYEITSTGGITSVGEVASSGRVGIADNGTEMAIATGPKGYIYNNSTATITEITDPDWPQANHVTVMDGFFIFANSVTTNNAQFFISNLLGGTTYDSLDFATAERYPDRLIRPYAHFSNLLMFGEYSIEVWFNSGNSDFPFEPRSGGAIDTGLGAEWSVQSVDNSVIFLDHEGIVRRMGGDLNPVRISDHAIEYQISRGTWADADSYTYTEEGHEFYVLTIPDTITLAYDAATQLWHQRRSKDVPRQLDVSRIGFHAKVFGKHIVGSRFDGKIYESSIDYASEAGEEIISVIQCPQIRFDNKRFRVPFLELLLEWGVGLGEGNAFKTFRQTEGGNVCNINGTWATQTSAADSSWNGVTYGDKFVAVGNSASGNVMYSSDGEAWSLSDFPGMDISISDLSEPPGSTFNVNPGSGITDAEGAFISADGTKYYVKDDGFTSKIAQYALSTAYDLGTASLTQLSAALTSVGEENLYISPDGLHLYYGTAEINQYDFGAAWDISTLSFVGVYDTTEDSISGALNIWVNDAGTLLLAVGNGNTPIIYEYVFGAAWDISTLTYTGSSLSIDADFDVGTSECSGIHVTRNGRSIIVAEELGQSIHQYTMTTPFDLSTASYTRSNSVGLTSPASQFQGMCVSRDDRHLYICVGGNNDSQFEYGLPPGEANDVAWSGGLYVAVGDQGGAYSSDGVTWETSDLSPNNSWQGVAWFSSASVWVAVASSGTDALIASSSDGVTWVEQTDGDIVGCNSVAASSTKAVFVGDNGVLVSTDTTNWGAGTAAITTEAEAENNAWQDVVYSSERGLFVAVANSGTNRAMWSSGNGSWFVSDMSGASNAGNNWNAISYGGGYFVAVSDTGTGNRIIRSAGGKSDWEAVTSPADQGWNELAWSGETLCKFAAVSDSGTGTRVMTSDSLDATAAAGTPTSDSLLYIDSATEPKVMLDVSGNTRTFDKTQGWRSMGKKGEYDKRVIWRRLGQHRSFTPRFAISAPVRKAVFAAKAEIIVDG